MRLGASLDPDERSWLNKLALDLVFRGMCHPRLAYLNAGDFPSSGRVETDVIVKWGAHRVPFQDVRRIDEADARSIWGWGAGHLSSILRGQNQIEAVPGRVGRLAEIDPELARRMPEPTLPTPTDARLIPGDISGPLIALVLEGPLFQRLCQGVEVPPSPFKRNLAAEVRLLGPQGSVPWNHASLISDAEMAALGSEFSNRAYTLLLGAAEGRIGISKSGAGRWEAEFEPGLLPS
jgi:hypothetical protein